VESYKKLVLLSLICHAKMPVLLAHSSITLKLKIENQFPSYKDLGTFFIKKQDEKF